MAKMTTLQPPSALSFSERWHLLHIEADCCATQMAIDQVLAESVWSGQRPPTLRLYRWPTPGLTIGCHQHPHPLSTPAVRRMTGGRAIYHQDELTVSLSLPAGHRLIRPTINATYQGMLAPFTDALRQLGLTACAPAPDKTSTNRFACFASPGETALQGHKLLGLAQRHSAEGALMVQASLPLSTPDRLPGSHNSAITGLRRFLPGLQVTDLMTTLCSAMSQYFQVTLTPAALHADERDRAEQLAQNAYRPQASFHATASA